MERPNNKLATVIRSVGVGAVGTVADLAALTLIATGLSFGPRLASPIALAIGLSVQFFGQKLFAFQDKRRAWGSQAALFLAVEGVAFLLNLALFDVAVRFLPVPYLLVRVAVQFVIYAGVCLPLWSRIFVAHSGEVRA